jgi:hypothetical protein
VPYGLCAWANSALRYRLDRKYERLESDLGIDANTVGRAGSVRFKVLDRPDARSLWRKIDADFPVEMDWLLQDAGPEAFRWLEADSGAEMERRMIARVLDELGPDGRRFHAEREQLVKADAPRGDRRWLDLYERACRARRQVRLQPLLARWRQIVFAKHHVMGGSFFAYTEGQSDAQGERDFFPGSALCLAELSADPLCKVRTLLDDPTGVIRDADVSYDGRRVLFAWKKSPDKDDLHLYEMEAASGAVRQLTFGLGFADYEPAYLPNGDIVFSSTRCVQSVDCAGTDVSNLYTCDTDGKYLRRLGFDQVHTIYPTVTEDGRVLYTRWDYNDRGQIFPQKLFQMNVDGVGQTEFYGNNSFIPTTLTHARGIPGTQKAVAIGTGHHTKQPGTLILIDPAKGRQEDTGAQWIAPVRATSTKHRDDYGQDGDLFQYPYPLSERQYLVSFLRGGWARQPAIFRIYFMDIDGHGELVADGGAVSCGRPLPLAPRPRPHLRPSQVDYRKTTGTYYLQDIYSGPGLAGIPRGTIKRLRVIALEYRTSNIGGNTNQGPAGGAAVVEPISIGNGAWDVKAVLGDATLREDGSAFFVAPARLPLYFQALDAEGCMVQSMRSWSTLQPGENASCVGCHESKNSTPLSGKNSYAVQLAPERLRPFYGPTRGFSFPKEIQPILDRHCTACHGDRLHTLPAGTIRQDLCDVLSPIQAEWRYATQDPGKGWEQPAFDSSSWKSGSAPFGPDGATRLGFVADVWLRRTFAAPGGGSLAKPLLCVRNVGIVEVYLNGRLAAKPLDFAYQFRTTPVLPEAAASLTAGVNLLAVHCRHDRGEAHVDAALLDDGAGPSRAAAGDKSLAFSLLGDAAVDQRALRRWSDAYVALTEGQVSRDASAAAMGKSNDLVNWIDPQSAPTTQPPYLTGAAKSRLLVLLRQGHYEVKLSQEDLDKLACWIDLAVPYCGDYVEANAWDRSAQSRHEHYANKRRTMQEIERKNIEDLLESRSGVAAAKAAALGSRN